MLEWWNNGSLPRTVTLGLFVRRLAIVILTPQFRFNHPYTSSPSKARLAFYDCIYHCWTRRCIRTPYVSWLSHTKFVTQTEGHQSVVGSAHCILCKSLLPQPFLFLLQDSLHGFPRLFTVISEHICFLLLVFLFLHFFSSRFRSVD